MSQGQQLVRKSVSWVSILRHGRVADETLFRASSHLGKCPRAERSAPCVGRMSNPRHASSAKTPKNRGRTSAAPPNRYRVMTCFPPSKARTPCHRTGLRASFAVGSRGHGPCNETSPCRPGNAGSCLPSERDPIWGEVTVFPRSWGPEFSGLSRRVAVTA